MAVHSFVIGSRALLQPDTPNWKCLVVYWSLKKIHNYGFDFGGGPVPVEMWGSFDCVDSFATEWIGLRSDDRVLGLD